MDTSLPPPRGFSLRRWLLGRPRNLRERSVFEHIALVPLLAWVGLGGDGLSSSAYGPDEAFRALGTHGYLAVPLALAVGLTVLLISACYMQVIERFPGGGGGYVVASKLLGPRVGVTAACALLVDYVLTVSVSIAAGADAIFSFLPGAHLWLKLGLSLAAVALLVVLNLRGVKESVTALTPIFVLFLLSHIVMLALGVFGNIDHLGATLTQARAQASVDAKTLGWVGLLAILARAYSMGAGTFTGIEAVSNGLPALREPRVPNGKRTMVYMAVSLAVTAGGILLCYLLADVHAVAGKTLNAVLAERIFGNSWAGHTTVVTILLAEGALLFVAAQTGFMDGPRVMANMAADRWIPGRFANLSDRLTTQNGVVLMGLAAASILVLTDGDIHALVVMYSINVFLVFTLTTLSMARAAWREGAWRNVALHTAGFSVCGVILAITLHEKLQEGGWLTLLITGLLVGLCFAIRRHYDGVAATLRQLDKACASHTLELSRADATPPRLDPAKPVAVLLVGRFGGLGMQTLRRILEDFPGHFQQMVFVGVATVDASTLKDAAEVSRCKERVHGGLQRYVGLARRYGVAASFELGVGTEVVAEATLLCQGVADRFPHAVFFGGQLMFGHERWYQRLLHNANAHAIQRRLQDFGVAMLILPIRLGAPRV